MYDHLLLTEKSQSGYAVSLDQAKHCSKHQKSWGQPKSREVALPNQLSRIHNHRTYSTYLLLTSTLGCQIDEYTRLFGTQET